MVGGRDGRHYMIHGGVDRRDEHAEEYAEASSTACGILLETAIRLILFSRSFTALSPLSRQIRYMISHNLYV